VTRHEQARLVALEINCIEAALADVTPVTLAVEPDFKMPDGWVVLASSIEGAVTS